MSQRSSIEWTNATWNPVIGCDKIGPGCENCYAETLAERFRGVPGHPFEKGFDFRLVPKRLNDPLTWKGSRRIFTCSMSDIFHEKVPLEYIHDVFSVMKAAHWHTFQVLTKRSERLAEFATHLDWSPNIWIGVSVENADYTYRINHLATVVQAAVRFVSIEPLLGSIPNLPLEMVDWVIVGGESGVRARPMEISWARDIHKQCKQAGVPFFLKQLGGRHGKRGGEEAVLDGERWREFPVVSVGTAAA
jgi:protein gp37